MDTANRPGDGAADQSETDKANGKMFCVHAKTSNKELLFILHGK